MARIGGIIQVKVNGATQYVKGDFTVNLGYPKRESVMGSDGLNHGYKETPQPVKLSGKISNRAELDLDALMVLDNATVIYTEANGISKMLANARYSGTGDITSGEGEVDWVVEADSAEVM